MQGKGKQTDKKRKEVLRMTKTTEKIVNRYRETYVLWLDLRRRGDRSDMEDDLLKELSLLSLVLTDDCEVSIDDLADIRESLINGFYTTFAK